MRPDPKCLLFTAREALGDSLGLYYYGWRVMDPNAGRFTSEDPLGFVDGANVYGYGINDPVRNVDPLGQTSACCQSGWKSQWPSVFGLSKVIKNICYGQSYKCDADCNTLYGTWSGPDKDCVILCEYGCWINFVLSSTKVSSPIPTKPRTPGPIVPPVPKKSWTTPYYPTREQNM
jgi:RHS repeat-associated protein